MGETPQPNTLFLFFFFLFFFFFTLTVATQTTSSVNCQTGSLRYPFGFSDGYPIRFNCSKKIGGAAIGEFAVQEVTDANIFVEIPPVCRREIRKIEQLFRENFAPSSLRNIILVQGCNETSSDCLIGRKFVEDRLNISRCKSQVRCLDGATTTTTSAVMRIGDVVNRSGCQYWFSSITPQSKSEGSLNLGRLRLEWWLKEPCGNTTCSENATCTDVKLADGGFGHRCTCLEGFRGNAFTVHGGCRSVGKRKGLHKSIVVGTGVLLGVSLITISIFAYMYGHKRSASFARTSIANRLLCELAGSSSVPFYTYKEIEKATDSFSDKNMLGTGAYGTVYAGEFPNSSWVAVKRLRRKDTTTIVQVANEIKLLSSLSHPNLVRLLGCCIAQGEPFLIYEFMPNGTLSQHLQHERGHTPLSWPHRLAITSQTANAIAYLHSSVSPPIYHRDIKSSNILLDYDFNSKISDFGLSRLGMSTDFDASHISTAPQGTPGYLDPRYHQDFQLSDKSDVYSFGVVVIEIISGFKVIDFTRTYTEVNLAALAIDRIGRGRVVDIIDPCLKTENDPKMFAAVQNLAELAFRCLSFHRNMRPTITEVTEDIQRIKLMYFCKETGVSKIDMMRLNSQESSSRV